MSRVPYTRVIKPMTSKVIYTRNTKPMKSRVLYTRIIKPIRIRLLGTRIIHSNEDKSSTNEKKKFSFRRIFDKYEEEIYSNEEKRLG